MRFEGTSLSTESTSTYVLRRKGFRAFQSGFGKQPRRILNFVTDGGWRREQKAGARSVGKGKGGAGTSNIYMYKAYSFACHPMLKILHLRAQATTPFCVVGTPLCVDTLSEQSSLYDARNEAAKEENTGHDRGGARRGRAEGRRGEPRFAAGTVPGEGLPDEGDCPVTSPYPFPKGLPADTGS